MPTAETPPKYEGEVPPRKPGDVMIAKFPELSGKKEEMQETKLEIDFTEKNPMNVKVGDKIKIYTKDGKIDPGWEIMDIDPKTGEMQLYKDGQFEKAKVTDHQLVMLNMATIPGKKAPTTERKIPESKKVLHGFPNLQSMETQISTESIPFTPGQKVKVKRTMGQMESDWIYRQYNKKNGRAMVTKGDKYKWVKIRKLIEWNK